MLYERLLDLAPDMRLERRLAERVAARLVIGMLLAVPICLVAAFVLAVGLVHAALGRIRAAGLLTGASIRHGLAGMDRSVRAGAGGTRGRRPGW